MQYGKITKILYPLFRPTVKKCDTTATTCRTVILTALLIELLFFYIKSV